MVNVSECMHCAPGPKRVADVERWPLVYVRLLNVFLFKKNVEYDSVAAMNFRAKTLWL